MNEGIEHLLILGCGYVGERLAVAARARGMRVTGTTRRPERAQALRTRGIEAVVADSPTELADDLLAACDALVDSIPLQKAGDDLRVPQADWLPALTPRMRHLRWAGYLSTTGVYGDAGGAWVDEAFACRPTSARGIGRLAAEAAWLGSGLPAEAFRIAGIYGPGRNLVDRLMAGGYRAPSWQPPHWSSRIHVDDIVAALLTAMGLPRPGRIVNLADDCPLSHAEYVCELARMLGAPPPVILDAATAERELSPGALAFFRDNKRVCNALLHRELLPSLSYPSFREAVTAL
jgi:nucleoside-diphosphate-sugar epimerase